MQLRKSTRRPTRSMPAAGPRVRLPLRAVRLSWISKVPTTWPRVPEENCALYIYIYAYVQIYMYRYAPIHMCTYMCIYLCTVCMCVYRYIRINIRFVKIRISRDLNLNTREHVNAKVAQ